MSYIDYVVKGIIQREGGYCNRAADRGGPTNWGITQETLSGWRGRPVSIQEVKDLSKEEAAKIYKELYIRTPKYDQLGDDALVEQLIDAGVNHGTKRARILLQRALKVAEDGIIGPATVAAAKALKPHQVFCRFMAVRLVYYSDCVAAKENQVENAAGWANRMAIMIRTYCRAVQAPDAVEAKLEAVAQQLNSRARKMGKRPQQKVAIAHFLDVASLARAAET